MVSKHIEFENISLNVLLTIFFLAYRGSIQYPVFLKMIFFLPKMSFSLNELDFNKSSCHEQFLK